MSEKIWQEYLRDIGKKSRPQSDESKELPTEFWNWGQLGDKNRAKKLAERAFELDFHQTIANDRLVITTKPLASVETTVVATGTLDAKSGLIKMDSIVDPSAATIALENRFALLMESEEGSPPASDKKKKVDLSLMHKRLGHIGKEAVKRTISSTKGIVLTQKADDGTCDDCVRGKMRKLNAHKSSRPRNLMDVIAGYEQGPFRLVSREGTKYNVKFIEKHSRYMKMFHLADIKDATLLKSFQPWLIRMQNRTGLTATSSATKALMGLS